ncbi:hydroxypyruvate reductase [Cribrihabitans marinus]|jgi:hydroxypyruvate reductase|uniref:Hydroxypyruvate reductase n=1 Tax=Cribrihabitans marinus TaxID=1227549 RepID=A0A1H7E1Q8_9RHOB|nr:glycerate kinase [Cribrihabitans marinus]GGH41734.1 hydroxypyruvate reductase [Cribrihabitans marinus]SEK07634.1 hydroxypyruvate reductase [Cribrihabitans marinus]
MTVDDAPALLRRMMEAAIAAADPATVLARHLPEKPKGRCIVIGAGKSAAAMALAVERAWPDVDLSGVVVTRYGHGVPTRRITVREASHPVPDAAGLAAAQEILRIAKSAGPDDLVLALISGGGSSLMPLPVPPLTLEDKIVVNRLLLRSGLTIEDMNRVRRRLSMIKGGGLALAAAPARLVTLAISDVPGDDSAAIASGPTVPDPTAGEDLTHLADRLRPDLPLAAREVLTAAPEPAARFDADYRMIATPKTSLEAAADVARAAGIRPVLLGDALEGEARELGIVMAGIAKSVAQHGFPAPAPAVLLSGGETTVSIGAAKPGRGGRNTEFLLSLAVASQGHKRIHAVAVDTDGIDGTEDAAGALIGPDMLKQATDLGLDAKTFLAGHDSYSLFDATGDLIRTGPTLTNVNDFRAVMIL